MQTVKVIILGDSSVGKTSLIQRFAVHEFSEHTTPTIGTDYLSRTISAGAYSVTLQIWDTAGQERYQSLGAVFYRGSEVCVLAYDITNLQSFYSLESWREEFLELANPKDPKRFPFFAIGTKADRESGRAVPYGRVREWADSGKCVGHFECSAKSGRGVEEAFQQLSLWVLENVKMPSECLIPPSPQHLSPSPLHTSHSCC